jgi:glycosyltransferase involved in cell wall biosynthesis
MKGHMENQHFTVVIPTRERCDTLEHSLHTCVIQDYDNLEILVSDNFSQDRTREVVEAYKDPRIRYINTGKRLSMTDNYEFALSHVKPEGYVIYIGDDDGLLPDAIRDLNTLIAQTGALVLQWDLPVYTWPTLNRYANRLNFRHSGSGVTVRDSVTTIQNVLAFKTPYSSLPVMYMYSAVAYEVINRVVNKSGRFYHSMNPDVYSGFAIAGNVDSFVHSKRPYTIGGTSHHGIGTSTFSSGSRKASQKFLCEDNLPFHSSLIFCISLDLLVVEAFLQARDHLSNLQKFTVNMQQLLFIMMDVAAPKPHDDYTAVKDAVVRLGGMHNIPEAAQRAIAAHPNRVLGPRRKRTIRELSKAVFLLTRRILGNVYLGRMVLDCSSLNVKNIYDASLLYDHILRLNDMNVIGLPTAFSASLANIKKMVAPEP